MTRRLPSLVSVTTGALLVRLVLTHAHTRYVKPSAGAYLIAAGVVLLVAGGSGLVASRLVEHDPPKVAGLLLIPLVMLVVVAPPSLGSAYVGQASNSTSGQGSYARIVVAGDGIAHPSMAQVVNRALAGDDLAGPLVTLTGFIAGADASGRPLLTRFSVKCCAADATVSQVALEWASRPPNDTWLVVTGHIVSAPKQRPVLAVTSSDEIEAPSDPYET